MLGFLGFRLSGRSFLNYTHFRIFAIACQGVARKFQTHNDRLRVRRWIEGKVPKNLRLNRGLTNYFRSLRLAS